MSIIPNYVPSGYKVVNVMLTVKDIHEALTFYNRAFGAETLMELKDGEGNIVHGEMRIADTIIMLSTEWPNANFSPETLNGTSVVIHMYTGDAEGMFEEALKAGCEVVFPLREQVYGDKSGRIKDPFGHHWIIARHLDTFSNEELQRRIVEGSKSTSPQ